MRIAIIGAGMAGLAAARTLRDTGATVTVFEKSRGPGGRAATRRRNGFVWDTGATSVYPRGRTLGRVMLEELSTEGLVKLREGVALHKNLVVRRGDPGRNGDRYCYQDGINTLGKRLAENLDVRLEQGVMQLAQEGTRYRVRDELFDGVIITCPIPQASTLLWSLNESRAMANSRYRACISVLLGYENPLPETPYFALLDPDQTHPLTWLSLESNKCPGRSPSVVAQMNRTFSQREYTQPDQDLVDLVSGYVAELFGEPFRRPAAADVMRWKYSQPESLVDFHVANPPGSRVVVTGDGFFGGRLEDAYEGGIEAAGFLLESLGLTQERTVSSRSSSTSA